MKRRAQETIPFRDGEAVVTGTYYPPTPATRLDPSDPAEFEVVTVSIDGKEIFPSDATDEEAAYITERMLELCAEADGEPDPDEARDRRIDDEMMERFR
jgi:hypothetical protein